MEFTAAQIASFLNGTVYGNKTIKISTLSKIEEASAGSLSFLANPKYTPFLYSTAASAVIVSKDFEPEKTCACTLIKVENPYESFATLLHKFQKSNDSKIGVHSTAVIEKSSTYGEAFFMGALAYVGSGCEFGDRVKIHPQVFIGDGVKLGHDVQVFAGAKILEDTTIGDRVVVHAGAVIGADGFGFSPKSDGTYSKVPQTGNVIIENDVEIGAGTTIDRATLGSTIIREGVKLDNMVQIAHNVEIGAHSVIAAQAGISGSTKIGSHCRIGGQTGIAGHLTIGNNVQIQGQSGVVKSLKDGAKVQGTPAIDYNNYYKSYVHFKNLDKHIKLVEKSIKSPNNE